MGYIWSGVYISGVGYIYLEWGIYIVGYIIISGVGYNISGVGYIYLEWGIYIWSGVYISGVGFIYLEQMTDFETYGTPYGSGEEIVQWLHQLSVSEEGIGDKNSQGQ